MHSKVRATLRTVIWGRKGGTQVAQVVQWQSRTLQLDQVNYRPDPWQPGVCMQSGGLLQATKDMVCECHEMAQPLRHERFCF